MGAYLNYTDASGATHTLLFDVVTSEKWSADNDITKHPVETGADVADNIRVGLATVELVIFVTNEPFKGNSFTTVSGQQVSLTIAAPNSVTPVKTFTAQEWQNGLGLRTFVQGAGLAGGTLVGSAAGRLLGGLLTQPKAVSVDFDPGAGMPDRKGSTLGVTLLTPDNPGDYPRQMYAALENLRTSAQLITVIGSKAFKENMAISSLDMDRDADTGTGAEITIKMEEIRFVTTQTVTAPKPSIPRAAPPVNKGPQQPKQATPAKAQSWLRHLQNVQGSTPQGLTIPTNGAVP